jgi:hypothetical protein
LAKAIFHLPISIYQKNAAKSNEQSNKLDYLFVIKEQLKRNKYLLENYHTKTNQCQKILLDSLHEFFIESKFNLTYYGSKFGFLDSCYVKVLLHLYQDLEIFNDERLIIEWYNKQKKSLLTIESTNIELEGRRHAINRLEAFIKWLEEPESSDEE